MSFLLLHGSYGLMFMGLILAGFGIPIPEDIVLLAAGVLSRRGITSAPLAAIVCAAGVLLGDLTIFMIARRLGDRVFARPEVARLLPPARRERIEKALARYGGLVIVVGRHMPGLRPAVFATAATHGMRPLRFVAWDAVGLCISGPIVFGLGYVFSDHVDLVRRKLAHTQHIMLVVIVCVIAAWLAFEAWRFRRIVPRVK